MLILFLSFLTLSDSSNTYYCDVSKSAIRLNNNANLHCNSSDISISQSSLLQVYVVGNTDFNGVTIENSIASFYLLETNIKADSAFSVIGGKVDVIVQKGSSSFTSSNDAGLSCSGNAEVTIRGESSARLTSKSTSYSGIGAGKSTSTCKLISINGKMTIDAQGGYNGAGIGGGHGYTEGTSNIDQIIIYDGKITATSPNNAGIGGGVGRSKYSSNVNSIAIYGGIIVSTGGEWGAGIGGGYGFSEHSSNVNTILISGGEVTSTGGRNGAGIGAGAGLSSTNASSVNHLSLIANRITSSSDSESNTICVNVQATGGCRADAIGNGSGGRVASKDETGAESQCSNYKCSFATSSSTTCFSPWKCDVKNCFNCPTSSVCSVCEKGYKLVNSICQVEEPQPSTQPTSHITSQPTSHITSQPTSHITSQPTQPPFSSSSTTLPPTQIPTVEPVATDTVSILFCPWESDALCQNAQSNWASERGNLIYTVGDRMNYASDMQKPVYQRSIDLIKRSTALYRIARGANSLNEALYALKGSIEASSSRFSSFNVIILQRGSMQTSDQVDFSILKTSGNTPVSVDYDVLTESNTVVVRGSDYRSYIPQLNFVFAENILVNGNDLYASTVSLYHSRFQSDISNKLRIYAATINADVYSSSCISNLADKCVQNVLVSVPVPVSKLDVKLGDNFIDLKVPSATTSSAVLLAAGNEYNSLINTKAAANQTAIVCTSDEVDLSLDENSNLIDYLFNLVFNNQEGSPRVEFTGDNWKRATFNQPIHMSSNDGVVVDVRSKPSNVNVEGNNVKGAGKKKGKLSIAAIIGISIAAFVLLALVVFLLVYFLVIKEKKEMTQYGDEQKLIDDDQY